MMDRQFQLTLPNKGVANIASLNASNANQTAGRLARPAGAISAGQLVERLEGRKGESWFLPIPPGSN